MISGCYGCKKFRARPANPPPPGLVPKCRSEQSAPFQVIGVDFAGPVKYRNKRTEAKSDDRNRNHWPLGIVERLIEGKDGVVRVVRLRSGRNRLERAIQHLYPLELSCDITGDEEAEQVNPTHLDPKARAFVPKRKAGIDATERIPQALADQEEDNDFR